MKKIRIKLLAPALFFGLLLTTAAAPWPGLTRAQAADKQPDTIVLTLETAVQEALKNYPLLQAATEQQQQAEETAKAAAADLLPKLSTSYSYYRLNDKPYGIFGPAGKIYIADQDDHTWKISAVQPLFTGFALTSKKKMAGLEAEGKELARKQAVLDLVKNVKVAYYRIILARKRLQVARQMVDNLTAHEHDTEILYRQGMIAYNDLLQAKVARSQTHLQQEKTERDLTLAKAALNLLMDHNLQQRFKVAELAIEPETSDEKLESLFQEALDQRPEISHLQVQLDQARMAVTMARSRYYPRVSLIGSYAQNGHNFGGSDNDYRNSDTAAVGLQADWTLFEWGKTRAEEKQSLHALKALENKMSAVKNQVCLEVQTAFSNLQLAAVNTRTAEAAVAQAEENYRITNVQYQQQMASSTTLLDAVTFLSKIKNSYHESLYGFLIARAELERALGRQ